MGAESKGDSMSYGEACQFLSQHTTLLELSDSHGARVAICPEWQGRVMTSTCDGPAGPSFGFINREFIEAGQPNPHFNNYGAEDRLWLSPEGGPFSLWFKPGVGAEAGQLVHPAGAERGRLPGGGLAAIARAPHEPADAAAERLRHAIRPDRHPRGPAIGAGGPGRACSASLPRPR